MKPANDLPNFIGKFDNCITSIDSHTEGEVTRLILDGPFDVMGKTMTEKLDYFRSHHDNIRCLLTKEPRGSKNIFAALVTENTTPEAKFGLIYMDARRYPYLCGHATIGAVVSLAKIGFLQLEQDENIVPVDTPSGLMEARVTVDNGKIKAVAVHMVPSFVYQVNQTVEVEGFGTIPVDIVCTGGFFAMVNTNKIKIEPVLKNIDILIDLGMKIIASANEQLEIVHPLRPHVDTIDVTEFYNSEEKNGRAYGRGVVVFGESHADRSPCGTGTASKLALLHYHGKIKIGQPYINYSPLDTSFHARLVKKEKIGTYDGLVTQIKGMAYITGVHHFLLESHDPFQEGYLI